MKIQILFDPEMSSRNQNKLLPSSHSLLLKPETSHKVNAAVEKPSLISNQSPRPQWTNTVCLCPRAAFEMRQRSLGSSAAWLSSERRDLKSRQLPTQLSFRPPPTSPASTQDVFFLQILSNSWQSGFTSKKEIPNKNLKACSVKSFHSLLLCFFSLQW